VTAVADQETTATTRPAVAARPACAAGGADAFDAAIASATGEGDGVSAG
jgi:hypothetical protein